MIYLRSFKLLLFVRLPTCTADEWGRFFCVRPLPESAEIADLALEELGRNSWTDLRSVDADTGRTQDTSPLILAFEKLSLGWNLRPK